MLDVTACLEVSHGPCRPVTQAFVILGFGLKARPAPRLRSESEAGSAASV